MLWTEVYPILFLLQVYYLDTISETQLKRHFLLFLTPVLSNWRPTGSIWPATPSNSARDYPPENAVHRPVFCCHSYLLSVVTKLTIC